MSKSLLIGVTCFVAVAVSLVVSPNVSQLNAQTHIVRDYFRDYFQNVPRNYSPNDPWEMGTILRTEVGHTGLFYNCDGDEGKRQSPYINWNQQNGDCNLNRPVRSTICQQLEEVKRRIRWGSCRNCTASEGSCSCASCDGIVSNQEAAELWEGYGDVQLDPRTESGRAVVDRMLAAARSTPEEARVFATANRGNPKVRSESSRQMVARMLAKSRLKEAPPTMMAERLESPPKRVQRVRKTQSAVIELVKPVVKEAIPTSKPQSSQASFLSRLLAPPKSAQSKTTEKVAEKAPPKILPGPTRRAPAAPILSAKRTGPQTQKDGEFRMLRR